MWSQLTLKMKTPPRLLLITLVLIIGASVVLCTTQADTSSIHASIDDVSLSLSNLKTNKTKYTNAFDEPFFAYIKRLHEQYGAKFSLYCYLSDIKDIGTSYQHDFANTSDWLKFGLHTPDTTRGYSNATYDQGKQDWISFSKAVQDLTGNIGSLDRVVRLDRFNGSKEALLGMKDAPYGACGLLTADAATRPSYFLNKEQLSQLHNNGELTDQSTSLQFFSTDMRGEWFSLSFFSEYEYRVPQAASVYTEIERLYSQNAPEVADKRLIFFTHEWQLYDGKGLNQNISWLEDLCLYSRDHNVPFRFPLQ